MSSPNVAAAVRVQLQNIRFNAAFARDTVANLRSQLNLAEKELGNYELEERRLLDESEKLNLGDL